MEATLEEEKTSEIASKTRIPPQLIPYLLKKGHAPLNGGGRPKGSKNAATILTAAAPRAMRRYVKEALAGSIPLLKDYREWCAPIESNFHFPQQVIVFMGDGLLPRAFDQPQPLVGSPESSENPKSLESLSSAV